MDVKDKYKVEERPDVFSLQPNQHLTKSLIWFLVIMLGTGFVLYFFYDKLGEGGRVLCAGLLLYLAIHGLYDFLFKLNVRYVFDKSGNSIYRENGAWGRKRLMPLDQAVVFVSSETGVWHYSMGHKKKQFIKAYTLSEDFGSGKKSQIKQEEFEQEILLKISNLISSQH